MNSQEITVVSYDEAAQMTTEQCRLMERIATWRCVNEGADVPWLQTLPRANAALGGRINLVNPEPDQIDFDTIATVLARIPRFGGHTRDGVFSVAQHCLEGAAAIIRDTGRREWAAAFLIHDAHEAYLGDIATPVLEALMAHAVHVTGDLHAGETVRAAVRSAKAVLDAAIHAKAGVSWPLDAATRGIVKLYDVRMMRTERDARLATPPQPWTSLVEGAALVEGCDLHAWSGRLVETLYRQACRDYFC